MDLYLSHAVDADLAADASAIYRAIDQARYLEGKLSHLEGILARV